MAAAAQTSSTEFVDMALSFLQRLIALDLLKRRDEIVATRRLRRRLLRDLLTGGSAPDELTALVADHGVDLRKSWRVGICDFGPGPQRGRRGAELEDAVVEAVDTFFGDRLIAFLSRPRATSIAILLPDGYPSVGNGSARDLLLGLKTFAVGEPYLLELAVGVSGAHGGAGAGPKALQEALDALAAAQRGIDAHGLVLFEELSGRFRLLQGQSGARSPTSRAAASPRCSSTTPGGTPTFWTRSARCWTTTSPSSPRPRRCSSTATPCRSGCGASRRCWASTSPTSTT